MVATTRLGLNAQTPGTNANTWGGVLNTQAIDLIDEAIAGVETIALTGNVTLTATNFVSNQSRNAALVFTNGGLSGPVTVTIPSKEKTYLVVNNSGQTLTFSAAGTTVSLVTGRWAIILCDGSNVFLLDPTAQAGQISAEVFAARDTAVSSAVAALTNGNAAVAAYDAFDDRYLGSKTSDPTVDNDGDPLLVGAMYWNSTANQLRIWRGGAWVLYSLPTISTQAQAEAGTDNATMMTPLRTKQALSAQVPVPGMVFISQQTVSSAVSSVDFTGLSSTYDQYVLELQRVYFDVANILFIRTSSDNGSTFDAGASDYYHQVSYSSAATQTAAGTIGSSIQILSTVSISPTAAAGGLSASVNVIMPALANSQTVFFWNGFAQSSTTGQPHAFVGGGRRVATSPVNAIRVAPTSGTIVNGSFKLYGMRKS